MNRFKIIILMLILITNFAQKANFVGAALIHPTEGVTYHALPEKWFQRAKNYCKKHYPALKEKPNVQV